MCGTVRSMQKKISSCRLLKMHYAHSHDVLRSYADDMPLQDWLTKQDLPDGTKLSRMISTGSPNWESWNT